MQKDKQQVKLTARAIALIWLLIKTLFLPVFLALSIRLRIEYIDLRPETTYTFPEHARAYGYFVEEHQFTTTDGYVLTLYRIPGTEGKQGPPVLLIHGLSNSANCWIVNQCTKAPGFIIADEGYDTWFINLRGSHLSRKHVSFQPDSEEYWDWSFPEIIMYDVPESVKFIKEMTGADKIAMIGHSQGGSAVTWSLAWDPDLSDHVALGISVGAPGGLIYTEKSIYVKLLGSPLLHWFHRLLGINVISDWSDDLSFAKLIKAFPGVFSRFAADLYDADLDGADLEFLSVYAHRMRGGTSTQNLEFWRQVANEEREKPKLHNYGPEKNLIKYGREEPPTVDFGQIKSKVAILGGLYDRQAPPENIAKLKNQLPSDKLVYYSTDYPLDHGGLIFSCNMKIFQDVLEVLSEHLLQQINE